MPTHRLQFPGSEGQLEARLDLPSGQARSYALFAHCFTCSKDSVAASRVSRALAMLGIGVLRFDFTGLGGSDGDFGNTNFSSNVQDLVKAADYLRQRGAAPSILLGHSLGGAAVLSAASQIEECKAVVTIGAPSDPAHVSHLFADSLDRIGSEGQQQVVLAGRKFVIRKQFLEDIAGQALTRKIKRLQRALLVMHSPQDTTVCIDHARKIYEAALHPKSFISLDGADHLLSNKRDADFAAQVISAWVSRYIPVIDEDPAAGSKPRSVRVMEAGIGKFAQHVVIGPHRFAADEPESLGGNDSGPSPYDFLLAALGTCTSMTLRMYADRKQLPLQQVEVNLTHDKMHATDCENCETKTGRIDHVKREIRLVGELDTDQRRRLMEIADKCPVHRTLHSQVVVDTQESHEQ